ncbi:MAG: 30S ribosome-binding factor RbfA [Rhodospirillales bacterium]|nr:MAG: 30S ribosome-binding factor RbfA [Rhodospirillales bacterium]
MSRHRSSRSSTEIGGKPRTPRQLRVGEELRHALAAVFERGDMRDPDLRGASITVTEVDVSPDLRNATAFVMPLGGADRERLLAAMRRAAPYFRAQLARAVELRHAPDLRFELDKGYDHAQRIDALLRATAPPRDSGAAPEDADS